MSKHSWRRRCTAFGLGLVLAAAPLAGGAGDDRNLYVALGGEAGLAALIERFLLELADDERINEHFVETDILRFQEKLTEFVCNIAGGPCEYTGDSMIRTHRGMDINDAEFNALVEDLILAMESLDIPTGTQNRLLARLAPLHEEIAHR